MNELLGTLDALAEQYPTVPARLAVTLLAVGGVVLISLGANRLRTVGDDEFEQAITDLLASLVVACGLLAALAVVLGVWGQAGTVGAALAQANIGIRTLGRVVLTIGLLAGTFVFVRFLRHVISDFLSGRDAVNEHQLEVTYRITQLGIYLLAGLIVLGFWQVDLSGLLIGAGVLGILIGMAAQQTLASIFAGFVLMFSRPFEIGDWVLIGENEGIVSDITIVSTRIQTPDGEYVIVPNDEVGTETIINYTRKGRLRIRVSVGVDYDTDLDRAEETIREAIDDLDELMRVPTPQVVVDGFADSSILVEIRFWIDNPSSRRRWRAKQAVVKSVNDAFNREGIKIPYPQRELSGRSETGGFRIADERTETEAPSESPPQADGGEQDSTSRAGDGER